MYRLVIMDEEQAMEVKPSTSIQASNYQPVFSRQRRKYWACWTRTTFANSILVSFGIQDDGYFVWMQTQWELTLFSAAEAV